jgi:type VI secretion system secreted protein VgrG
MEMRSYAISSDSPVNNELLFLSLIGHETLSRPSHYELTIVSPDFAISADDILGYAFKIEIEFPDATEGLFSRNFNGIATRFRAVGIQNGYAKYAIHLQSWFGLLTKRQNSRIFQDLDIKAVMDKVFSDSPIRKIAKKDYKRIIGGPLPMTYCVQYQQSDYHFLSRLLEDAGIYYWFESHSDTDVMYFSDASDLTHSELPAKDVMRFVKEGASEGRFNEITDWISSDNWGSGKFASRDTDYKAISKKLSADHANPATHELADLEMFEFPGGYHAKDDLPKIGKLRQEEITASRSRSWALTSWPDVAVGKTFKFEGHPDMVGGDRKGEYLIGSCTFMITSHDFFDIDHDADEPPISSTLAQYISEDAVNSCESGAFAQILDYFQKDLTPSGASKHQFLITVLPHAVSFRPPRLTPPVVMPGPQSAIVVGKATQEIDADALGRVKVHFPWDRYDKSDQNSTCWVRVSQPWAGQGWGGYFIPRIGQEVIVDFLNGDPNRPLIMGRVYNSDNAIPFESHTQSGFISRSTPEGTDDNFNMIRMEDLKGNEEIYIHAERDHITEVEHNQTLAVLNDREKTVMNNELSEIRGNRTEKVIKNESINVGGSRSESVGGSETVKIYGSRLTEVSKDEELGVFGDRGVGITGNDSLTVDGFRDIEVKGADNFKVTSSHFCEIGDSRDVKITKNDTLNVGKSLKITAGDEIILKTGSSRIIMKKDGSIVIEGLKITIQGSDSVMVKSGGTVTLKGSKVVQN